MLHGGTIGSQRILQLIALHVGQDLCADVVQRCPVQRVETDGQHHGEGGILHGGGLTEGQAADGVGRAFGGERRVEGAAAQQLGLQGGGAVGGDGGVQHGVDAAQSRRGHLIEGGELADRICRSGGVVAVHSSLCQAEHRVLLVVIGEGISAGVVERDAVIGQLVHFVLQMAGQVGVGNRGLAVGAVHEVEQVGALEQDALEALQRFQTDAVGLVGVAILVHQLGSVAVGLGLLGFGQLAAQLVEAGLDGGVQLQILLGLLGDIVADGCGLAGVRVGGDGLRQKALDVGGILVGGSELCGGLVGVVLRQQIEAGGDLHIADGTDRVRRGKDAASQTEGQCRRAEKGKKFVFHKSVLLMFCVTTSPASRRGLSCS